MASVVCPAGEPIAEARPSMAKPPCEGCLCRIEMNPILVAENPGTYENHCTDEDGYRRCYTWLVAKHNRFASALADKGGDWWQIGKSGRIEYAEKPQESIEAPRTTGNARRSLVNRLRRQGW